MLYVKQAQVNEAWSRHIEIHDGNTKYFCYLWANEESEYMPCFRINRIAVGKLDIWFDGGPHSFATIYGFCKDQLLNWKEEDFMKVVNMILAHGKDAHVDIDMETFLW